MNTTQKNYTIKRIQEIGARKVAEIMKKDRTDRKSYDALGQVSGEVILQALAEGTLNILVDDGGHKRFGSSPLNRWFDTSNLQKIADKQQSLLETPKEDHTYGGVCNFASSETRVAAVGYAIVKATDSIMLGSDEEALQTIKYFTNTQF